MLIKKNPGGPSRRGATTQRRVTSVDPLSTSTATHHSFVRLPLLDPPLLPIPLELLPVPLPLLPVPLVLLPVPLVLLP